MTATSVALVVTTLLCSLVAGFLFAFAVVVMPGIARLGDRDFLRAFQVVDGVIQRGQPLFGLVWIGSVLALGVGLALGMAQLTGADRLVLVLAAGIYLLGVQLPTVGVNIPLNNEVQSLDLDAANGETVTALRRRFERQWNRWNVIRTTLAILASMLLVILLLRL